MTGLPAKPPAAVLVCLLQIPVKIQRSPFSPVNEGVDRLGRNIEPRPVLPFQMAGNLIRRPTILQPSYDIGPQDRPAAQLLQLAAPSPGQLLCIHVKITGVEGIYVIES